MRNVITMSIVTAILLSGCSMMTKVDYDKKTFEDLDKKYLLAKNKKEERPITIIKTSEYYQKKDSLNHNINFNNFDINLNIKNGIMKDIKKFLPFNVYIDEMVENKKITNFSHSGKVSKLLDKLATITNSFWSFNNGIIEFKATKTIVYKFPLLSNDKINLIYNINSQNDDQFEVGSVESNVFEEMKEALTAVASEYNYVGNYDVIIEDESVTENTDESITNDINTKASKNGFRDKNSVLASENNINSNINTTVDSLNHSLESISEDGIRKGKNTNPESKVKPKKNEKNEKKETVKKPASTKLNYYLETFKTNETNNNKGNNVQTSQTGSSEDKINDEKLKESETTEDNEYNRNDKDSNVKQNKRTERIVTNLKKEYNSNPIKVSVLKESGMIVATVNRDFEEKIDNIVYNVTKNVMSNMVAMEIHVLEVQKKKLKKLSSEISVAKEDGLVKSSITSDSRGMTIGFDSISKLGELLTGSPYIDGGLLMDFMVSYLTEDNSGKTLTKPKIMTIPNVPSRVKSSVGIPYMEPAQVSVGQDSQLSYEIKYVNDGIDMALLTNVYGDDIFISLGININQYLGDKVVNAGELGTISIPIQAPRTLNTSLRMKAGDITILGGINRSQMDINNIYANGVPSNVGEEFEDTELIIIASPKIIRFVEDTSTNK